jgi:ATP-binding cassette subfamily B multidrug efflux pump
VRTVPTGAVPVIVFVRIASVIGFDRTSELVPGPITGTVPVMVRVMPVGEDNLLKLFKFLKPYILPIIAVVVLTFLHAMSELYLPKLMADIVDIGIVNGDTVYIFTTGGRMLFVAVLGTVTAILAGFLSSRTALGFGKILRNKVFSRVESYSLQEFDKFGASSLITRTTNDITQIQHMVIVLLRMMLKAPLMCIGGIIMAVTMDARLSMFIIIVLPILAVLIYVVTRLGMPLFKEIQEKIDRINLVLRERLTGIRVIRAFNRVDYAIRRFDEANKELTGTTIRVNQIMAALMPIMVLLLNFTIIIIIWFGGIRIDNGNMQVGDLMAFIQYVSQIMFSLMMMSMLFVMIPRASVSAGRINAVLETTSRLKDGERVDCSYEKEAPETSSATSLEQNADRDADSIDDKQENICPMTDKSSDKAPDKRDDSLANSDSNDTEYGGNTESADNADSADNANNVGDPDSAKGEGFVEFEDVTFSYPGAEKPVLSGISFIVQPGEMTAIIGGIGSGKSTLIQLIPRFYDVDKGSIQIDKTDIREIPIKSLRAKIGYVPQKAVLFSGSIAENIRYGKEDASDEDVRQAAEIAQAAEFIHGMPDGFNSFIAQGGINLSGGQKQRLSIARAIVRRPLVYVFDDSFSALDYKTDARLRAALRKETANAAVIIVAQRISTVMDADQIIVLDDGQAVGIGRHRELLDTCSVYRELVSSQLSLEELA